MNITNQEKEALKKMEWPEELIKLKNQLLHMEPFQTHMTQKQMIKSDIEMQMENMYDEDDFPYVSEKTMDHLINEVAQFDDTDYNEYICMIIQEVLG